MCGEPHAAGGGVRGKDAFIVDADADLDAAADAAAWGALSNAGQTCIGVERVYVVESVYRTFLERSPNGRRSCGRVRTGRPITAR